METYYCHAVDIDGVLVDAIGEHQIEPGASIARPMLDGLHRPKLAAVYTLNTSLAMSSQSIVTALDALDTVASDPFGGKTLTGTDYLTTFLQKSSNWGAGRTAGANHLKIVINDGLVVPVSLSAGNDGPGTVSLLALAADGGAAYTASQALAGVPAPDELFFAGPAKLNNVAVEGIQSVSLDFGINLTILREAGSVGPEFIGIESIQPVIRIVTTDVALLSTYAAGVAIASSTLFYLKKGTTIATRVANATAEHISFTVNAGMIKATPSGGQRQTLTVEILPIFDGTNQIVVVDTTSAIT